MTIRQWIEITCEECTEGSGLRFPEVHSATKLRAEFKTKGWIRKKVDDNFVDLCPNCKVGKYE